MPRTTIVVGIVLIALGLAGYLGSGLASATALIPSGFGLVIAVCGAVATRPALRTGGIVAAAILALLGLGGTLSRIIPMFGSNEGFTLTLATGAQLVMAAVCLVYLVLAGAWLFGGRKKTGGGA